MAKLVQKSGYIQNSSGAANYMKYIATREGVEILPGKGQVTPKQEHLIRQVLRDFPDSAKLFEYEDYLAAHTAASASAFLSMALDSNMQSIQDGSGYMKYISQRPGVELHGSHGLFSAGNSTDLNGALEELAEHNGRVWTIIYSLRREDAARLGYDHADAWQGLLLAKQAELAKAMGIRAQDFQWYAAYHDAGHHPHIHMMVWSADPRQGFLTREGIAAMRSTMTNAIFHDELLSLYQEKDVSYKELVRQSRQAMAELTQELANGIDDVPSIAEKLLALSDALEPLHGKKQYGYLPKELKTQVDEIVDALEELPEVAQCYAAWNELRDQLESYYHQKPRKHLPLSQQKEFRAIKNAVIREADGLRQLVPTFEDDMDAEMGAVEEWDAEEMPKITPLHMPIGSRIRPNSYLLYEQNLDYRIAKRILQNEKASLSEQETALHSLEQLWRDGFELVAHLLGKCYRDGVGTPVDTAKALRWFQRSAEAGDDFSQYALGKLLLKQNRPTEAIHWLRQAASAGNPYAQYQMGKEYITGDHLPQDIVQGIRYWKDAAVQRNQWAQWALGRLYLQGRGALCDAEEAAQWLTLASTQGNACAQHALSHMDQHRDPTVLLSVTRLLRELGRLFQSKAVPVGPAPTLQMDRKRRRQLQEKRLAHGHKADDHEEHGWNGPSM